MSPDPPLVLMSYLPRLNTEFICPQVGQILHFSILIDCTNLQLKFFKLVLILVYKSNISGGLECVGVTNVERDIYLLEFTQTVNIVPTQEKKSENFHAYRQSR